ncbi:hypothetical protein BASA81_006585 [Batrachochytrium salamandrivorans]|nr:hypothetical protein BASA81_006585 [Batrachochytrium salamandrivorans]
MLLSMVIAEYLRPRPPPQGVRTTNELVMELLKGVEFTSTVHAATITSQDSANVRGEKLESGAKAMVLQIQHGDLIMCVLSASKSIDFKLVKRYLQVRDVGLASAQVVFATTGGCLPGAVPPFGSLFGMKTLVDPSLWEQGPTINFNAGLRTHSVQMFTQDYLTLEHPLTVCFSK